MEKIIDGIYLGSDKDVPEAKRRRFARLCCCKDGIDSHRSMLEYTTLGAPKDANYYFAQRGNVMALNLIDSETPEMIPSEVIDAGLKFIYRMRQKGENVFIHCNAGHSRGPAITLMYLRAIGEFTQGFYRAQEIFKTLYEPYSPAKGMWVTARDRWRTLPEFLKG